MMERFPIDNLHYFMEWGSRKWQEFMKIAIDEFIGRDLCGIKVMDFGSRSGKMACFFALLGAEVIAVDIVDGFCKRVKLEAQRWHVAEHVHPIDLRRKNFNFLPKESIDIIFTKSVLVVVPNFETVLKNFNFLLKRNGKFVFLENGKGFFIFSFLRCLHHRKWDFSKANYFTDEHIKKIEKVFGGPIFVRKSFFPPIYLVMGEKKEDA